LLTRPEEHHDEYESFFPRRLARWRRPIQQFVTQEEFMSFPESSSNIEQRGPRRSRRRRAIGMALPLLALLFSSSGLAADVWHGGTLRAIYPLADGSFALAFTTDAAACTAPPNPKYFYVTVGQNSVTEEASKKFYAAALSAFVTGAPLSIVFSDNTSMCYVNRVFFGS
jgi:hypothetical protein